ncbi:hypothetical protein MIR68_002381 [Amoeboaphelidium protococcarum]|nr:hypothetical protein MIR68_002381 [Amoeboaphelidium protococcarum]
MLARVSPPGSLLLLVHLLVFGARAGPVVLVCAMTAAEVMLSFYWIAASQVGDYSGYLAKRCWTVGWCWPQRKAGWLAGWRKEGWAGDGHRRKLSGWWVVAGEGRNQMPGKAGFGMGQWPWWSSSLPLLQVSPPYLDGCQYKACCIAPSSVLSLVLLVQKLYTLIDWLASCTQNSQIGPPPHSHRCRSLDSQASLAGPCHCLHVAPQFIFIGVAARVLLIATGTVVQIHRYLWLVLIIVCMWRRSLFLLALLQESSSSPHRHWYRSLDSQVSLAGSLSLVACGAVVNFHRRRCKSITVLPQFISSLYYSHSFIGSTVESLDIRLQIFPFEFVKASLSALQSTVKSWLDLLGKSLYYYSYYIEMHCCCGSPHNRVCQKFCVGAVCLQIL